MPKRIVKFRCPAKEEKNENRRKRGRGCERIGLRMKQWRREKCGKKIMLRKRMSRNVVVPSWIYLIILLNINSLEIRK